jgi:DNA-binding transcriptional LysR family regulator
MYTAEESRYFHDILTSLFSSGNVLPRYVQHLSRIQPILALVKAGLGATIVPAPVSAMHYQGVKLIPLRLGKPCHAELFAVWRRNDANPIMERMLRLVREFASAVPGGESKAPSGPMAGDRAA